MKNSNSTLSRHNKADVLIITSYPPRQCGIATYSHDLIESLEKKFSSSFNIKVCALENETQHHFYDREVRYILETNLESSFTELSDSINYNDDIKVVLLQHEFGFFRNHEEDLLVMLQTIEKPIAVVFHTVLPNPDKALQRHVMDIAQCASFIIVMTNSAADILSESYQIDPYKIMVIPHGTHLLPHFNKYEMKAKYGLEGKHVLSTFGLLSAGKSIETTLHALSDISIQHPEVIFLIIGKTHPAVVSEEGEAYREKLQEMVHHLRLENYVQFIDEFLPLPTLLEYLQLTDIYLFTSKDRNQAVSGTFSYAISCGCPIVSTPIPHAKEVLQDEEGLIFDFEDSQQLATLVNDLLRSETLRDEISARMLQRMAPTAWDNSAIAHAMLFEHLAEGSIKMKFNLPRINLNHIKKLTDDFAMIQFSIVSKPDPTSGYTLDDNARAMVAMCQNYENSRDDEDLELIYKYYNFIRFCQQPEGYFLNYVDTNHEFTDQNYITNLEDSNGRAIWALGYLISQKDILPEGLIADAQITINNVLATMYGVHSPRAMAFTIKGLYYRNLSEKNIEDVQLITEFANRINNMYLHERDENWKWFESYLTYANSIIPEAMLCAWIITDEYKFKDTAEETFTFLLSRIFGNGRIKVISNKRWFHRDMDQFEEVVGGEQPIDISYTIMALAKFYDEFKRPDYLKKMETAFSWFLGANHLHQIMYNPKTGGCYDGLEELEVNTNQGAESTVSYLMARLTIDKIKTIVFKKAIISEDIFI